MQQQQQQQQQQQYDSEASTLKAVAGEKVLDFLLSWGEVMLL